MAAQGSDELGQPARGDDGGRLSQLLFHAVQNPVDHVHVAVNDAGAHTVNGIFSNDMAGNLQADVGQLGRLAAE